MIGTPEGLANFRGLAAVPTGSEATYELALTLALGMAQDETDQRLEYVVEDVATIVGSGGPTLLLPELPVVAVDSVTVVDTPGDDAVELVETDDWTLAAGDDGRFGVLYRNGGSRWPKAPGLVTVTYAHGYGGAGPEVPAGLLGVIYKLAARGVANPDGLAQQTVGRWSGTYGSAAGFAFTAADKLALARYRPGRRH